MIHNRFMPPFGALLAALFAIMPLGTTGCSDDSGTSTTTAKPDVQAQDAIVFGDAGLLDVGKGGAADATLDGSHSDADSAAPDAGSCTFPPNPQAGDPGAPCSSPTHCDSGYCVDSPLGKVCTRTCVECCPGGWECEQAPSGDAVFICLPRLTALCLPCTDDAACETASKGALCVRYGEGEAHFCGGQCLGADDCPAGYACKEAEGTNGKGKQCVRESGLCACLPKAIASGTPSLCVTHNQHGTCTGSRKCDTDGLTACSAPAPAAETCNGVDDDCDGQTDEAQDGGTCDITNTHGTCVGTRTCLAGKPGCDGPQPAPEVCDGQDNDCDGKTDEGCDEDKDGYCKAGAVIADLPAGCTLDIAACNSGAMALPAWCPKGIADCDDSSDAVHPGASEQCGNKIDDDCDGETDQDKDGSSVELKGCETFHADQDKDGFGGLDSQCLCQPEGIYTAKDNKDCDDKDGKVNPKQKEICGNGKDDDCDNKQNAYDAVNCTAFWPDGDGDGYGAGKSACLCDPLDNFKVNVDGDCDDKKIAVHPKAVESCNGVDDDCDGDTDEAGAKDCKQWFVDVDKDTWGDPDKSACLCDAKAPFVALQGKDCDDTKYNVNPGFAEQCGDNLDNDCDAQTDEEGAKGCQLWHLDVDGDKFGALGQSKCLCEATGKYTATKSGDCDDAKTGINPEALEICDNLDNNCDKAVDELCDADGDGFCAEGKQVVGKPKVCPSGGGDCNDKDKTVHPAASEICDGIDNDCKEGVDQGCDDDGDGYCDAKMALVGTPKACPKGGGDCDDQVSAIHPAATEVCDGKDNNCKAGADEGCDDDKDGFCDVNMTLVGKPAVCPNGGGDCNDASKAVNPAAPEICDGLDNNCKAGTDEGCDDDKDGFCDKNLPYAGKPAICPKGPGDCDDSSSAIHPQVTEICDEIDNNCVSGVDEGCDDDKDGFCDAKMVVKGIPKSCPKGVGDCCDIDPKAWPQQPDWFTVKTACGGYDFNCQSGDQKQVTTLALPHWVCEGLFCVDGVSCSAAPIGWDGYAPACGSANLWITDFDWNGNIKFPPVDVCTVKKGYQKTQACH